MRIGLPGIPFPEPITCPQQCWHSAAFSWHQKQTCYFQYLFLQSSCSYQERLLSCLYFQIRENKSKLFLGGSLPEKERRWGSREERNSVTALKESANTSLDVVFCFFRWHFYQWGPRKVLVMYTSLQGCLLRPQG